MNFRIFVNSLLINNNIFMSLSYVPFTLFPCFLYKPLFSTFPYFYSFSSSISPFSSLSLSLLIPYFPYLLFYFFPKRILTFLFFSRLHKILPTFILSSPPLFPLTFNFLYIPCIANCPYDTFNQVPCFPNYQNLSLFRQKSLFNLFLVHTNSASTLT